MTFQLLGLIQFCNYIMTLYEGKYEEKKSYVYNY